jgi:hypothetical protein
MDRCALRAAARGFALVALAAAIPAAAQIEERLAGCARIAAPSERLSCYDGLSASAPSNRARTASPSRDEGAPDPAAFASAAAADFGFDRAAPGRGPDGVQSRYDGEFTGWSGSTLFRLENGQVWKQAQAGRVTHRATRPAVTIRRGAFGNYRLSVEGVPQSVRVERIR